MPEVGSAPPNCTVSGWLYQPFESGLRPRVPATDVGAVASYLSAKEPVPVLPALSVHVPPTDAAPSSGPENVAWLHEPRPDVPSVPENETVSWWLYQPLESAAREGVPATEGAVESYWNAAVAGSTLPALSVHEPLTAALPVSGPEYVFCVVHEAIPDVTSVPPKETVTGWSYQPFASGPRPSVAEASGAVESYASGNAPVPTLPALS
jgi:hypothetical protein